MLVDGEHEVGGAKLGGQAARGGQRSLFNYQKLIIQIFADTFHLSWTDMLPYDEKI